LKVRSTSPWVGFSNPLQHNLIDYEVLGNETLYIVAPNRTSSDPLFVDYSYRCWKKTPWILQPLTSPARQIIEQEFGQAGMRTPAESRVNAPPFSRRCSWCKRQMP